MCAVAFKLECTTSCMFLPWKVLLLLFLSWWWRWWCCCNTWFASMFKNDPGNFPSRQVLNFSWAQQHTHTHTPCWMCYTTCSEFKMFSFSSQQINWFIIYVTYIHVMVDMVRHNSFEFQPIKRAYRNKWQ